MRCKAKTREGNPCSRRIFIEGCCIQHFKQKERRLRKMTKEKEITNICEDICHTIQDCFGHKVEPKELVRLIENSPVVSTKQ